MYSFRGFFLRKIVSFELESPLCRMLSRQSTVEVDKDTWRLFDGMCSDKIMMLKSAFSKESIPTREKVFTIIKTVGLTDVTANAYLTSLTKALLQDDYLTSIQEKCLSGINDSSTASKSESRGSDITQLSKQESIRLAVNHRLEEHFYLIADTIRQNWLKKECSLDVLLSFARLDKPSIKQFFSDQRSRISTKFGQLSQREKFLYVNSILEDLLKHNLFSVSKAFNIRENFSFLTTALKEISDEVHIQMERRYLAQHEVACIVDEKKVSKVSEEDDLRKPIAPNKVLGALKELDSTCTEKEESRLMNNFGFSQCEANSNYIHFYGSSKK